jgi:protease IV
MDILNNAPTSTDPTWERKLVEKMASEGQKEQVRRRRWGNFFKALTFVYIAVVFSAMMGWLDGLKKGGAISKSSGDHTAVVKLKGVIDSKGAASAKQINASLKDAFKDSGSKGVILHINSPGGSPVQSALINTEMKRLRAKYPEKPLYVVVDELCASGGYYVAVAADKIFVDPASIVGSIGVIMDGFGFTGSMEKLGVERRAYTAGENKALLDPFAPQNPKHKEHIQGMLADIHQLFITAVKDGRGARLKADTPDLFSGLVWSGQASIKLGLADATGSVSSVARDIIKAEELVDYTHEESALERFAKRLGANFGEGFSSSVGEQVGLQQSSVSGVQMVWRP